MIRGKAQERLAPNRIVKRGYLVAAKAAAAFFLRTLACGDGFFLATYAGFFEVLTLANLRQDAGLLAKLLEALHSVFKAFALVYPYCGFFHGNITPPSLIKMVEGQLSGLGAICQFASDPDFVTNPRVRAFPRSGREIRRSIVRPVGEPQLWLCICPSVPV